MKSFFYNAKTQSGTSTEFSVETHDESIANTEAKLTVERWLKDEGEPLDRLTEFNLVFVKEPA